MDARTAGAIFDFAAYLTMLEKPITVGAQHEVPVLMDALSDWAEERGVDFKEVDHDWNKPTDLRMIQFCDKCHQPYVTLEDVVVQGCGCP